MSMGFLVPQEEAAILRGPMVHKYLKEGERNLVGN